MVAIKQPQIQDNLLYFNNAFVYSVGGTIGLVCFAFLAVCIVKRHRPGTVINRNLYELVRPQNAVVLKYCRGVGPAGLKNSPTFLPSPLSSDSSNSSPMVPSQPAFPSPEQPISRIEPSELGPHRGFIDFSLQYSFENAALQVNVLSCRDLPEIATVTSGQCLLDPYVKLQLLPEKQHRVKTRLVRASTNPEYNEIFTMYGIRSEQIAAISLHFAVIAFDRYSRDTLIAEAVYPLKDANLLEVESKEVELELGSHGQSLNTDRGQVLLSFCYQPATNRITVVLLKAKDLPKLDITGVADPYVKIYMLYKGQRVSKKKSHVKKRTQSPVYNESFVFELPPNSTGHLDDINFEITVLDWDRITKNEVMGKCFIGSEDEHWAEVRNNPRCQIAEWHQLHL